MPWRQWRGNGDRRVVPHVWVAGGATRTTATKGRPGLSAAHKRLRLSAADGLIKTLALTSLTDRSHFTTDGVDGAVAGLSVDAEV